MVSGDESKGKELVLNPSVSLLLPRKADMHATLSTGKLRQLEEAARSLLEMQNFQFWLFGAVTRLIQFGEDVPD